MVFQEFKEKLSPSLNNSSQGSSNVLIVYWTLRRTQLPASNRETEMTINIWLIVVTSGNTPYLKSLELLAPHLCACASRCNKAILSRLKDGGFGCLRHAWIRSDSVPVPGWVRNLLSCDLWHAPSVALPWGEQADAGAGDRLKGDPLLCLLMAELDATLKQITAGLRFSGTWGFQGAGKG